MVEYALDMLGGRGPARLTLASRADRDVADFDVIWPLDREGNRAGDGFRRDRELGNLLITAAHCVTGIQGTLAFVPDYTNGNAPTGSGTSRGSSRARRGRRRPIPTMTSPS